MAAVRAVGADHADLLDDEITALALQLEEVGIINQSGKGKYLVDNPPDGKVARDSFQAEIAAHLSFLRDAKLAHSVASAIDSDAQAIAELVGSEEQAVEDRRFAESLREEGTNAEELLSRPSPNAVQPLGLALDLEFSDEESEAGPSVSYAERQAKALGKLAQEYECCVCFGNFKMASTAGLPCGDRYCNECLKGLFLRAITDEELFPPRCCREPIPLELVSAALSPGELKAFREAEDEFSTTDRTYCGNAHCGQFIPKHHIQVGRAECGTCGSATCSMCKNAYHQGNDCPADPALQATLTLAHAQGWQRCYSCRSMVELDIGCNHMTCKCGAQFCYVCGQRWKECGCDQWNEERLVRRAQEVVGRDAGPHILPNIEVNRRVAAVRENLRENDECTHPGWLNRVEGNGMTRLQCEICARGHRRFILECPRCHIRICADCRRNRLR